MSDQDGELKERIAELEQLVERLYADSICSTVQIEALLYLCRVLGERVGFKEVDGLPILEWFQRNKLAQVQKELLRLENASPAFAARLQAIFDATLKRLGEEPPPPEG